MLNTQPITKEHHDKSSDTCLVNVRIGGFMACFSRPECKVERMSYEVPTPSAIRGVLDAILWKPEMRWHVRSIAVLKPIRFLAVKRNELQKKIALKSIQAAMRNPTAFFTRPAGAGSADATPRNTVALKDVVYLVEAEPVVFSKDAGDTPMKYASMFDRRVAKGQCHQRPYLGCREFAAWFEPPIGNEQPIAETRDLGCMLYDIRYDLRGKKYLPVFFKASIQNGVVDTRADVVLPDATLREEMMSCSYRF